MNLARTRSTHPCTLRLLVVVAIGLWCFLAAMPSATAGTIPPAAQVAPGLEPLHPGPQGYFTYTVAAGQDQAGAVTVTNPTSSPATFDVSAVDATTSEATGVVFSEPQASIRGTGRWLHLGTTSVHLGGRQSRVVQFAVDVPTGSPAGDYVTGIAAESAVPPDRPPHGGKRFGVALTVSTRVVVAVVIHIPGSARVAMNLGPPALKTENGTTQVASLPVEDVGRLLAQPRLTARIRTCGAGREVVGTNRQLGTFVPRTTIRYDWPLGSVVLGAGCYRISDALTYMGHTLATASSKVEVTPAQASVRPRHPRRANEGTHSGRTGLGLPIGLGIAVLLVMAALMARSRRTRRRLERELTRLQRLAD